MEKSKDSKVSIDHSDFINLLEIKKKHIANVHSREQTVSGIFSNDNKYGETYETFLASKESLITDIILLPVDIEKNISTIQDYLPNSSYEEICDKLYFLEILLTIFDHTVSIDHKINTQSKFYSFDSIIRCPYRNITRGKKITSSLFNDFLFFHPCSERVSDLFEMKSNMIYYNNIQFDASFFYKKYFQYIKSNINLFEELSNFSFFEVNKIEILTDSIIDYLIGTKSIG